MFSVLDIVVLDQDLPASSLLRGDLGTVVEVYEPGGLEAEFVAASGKSHALVTLQREQVRPVRDGDMLAVRRVSRRDNRTS